MGKLYDRLMQDYRIKEGLNACINCGTCTAICPAAEFYRYDPRRIVDIVQHQDDAQIEELLKSDTIWYCGECLSCVTRCPRKNAAGLIIMALRSLSIQTGFFMESEKGRQMYLLCKDLNSNILNYGYCVYPRTFKYKEHQEAGVVWKWEEEHLDDIFERLGGNLDGEGAGAMRKIPQKDLDELKKIYDITGATQMLENVRAAGLKKAEELGLTEEEYAKKLYTESSNKHFNH
ncbi:MAG: 4Fe-4S dicluster domain-containing protein [Bacteroidales bacterium]|nr:4Fe-4S dicluster domain-containing protein [Bacteroidales bacterium]MBR5908206.1 4Fe-4S dicluster domain-containing protein [Bacteroidales bacterium]